MIVRDIRNTPGEDLD